MKTLAFLIASCLIFGCNKSETDSTQSNQPKPVSAYDAEANKRRQDCTEFLERKKERILELMKENKFEEAAVVASTCTNIVEDKELDKLKDLANAERLKVRIKEAPEGDKIFFIKQLISGYPAEGKAYDKLQKQLEAKEAAQRKSKGVSIGMTQNEVIASSWGRPQSVSKTTFASGLNEQWVYKDMNYLYFENGKLTAIQH